MKYSVFYILLAITSIQNSLSSKVKLVKSYSQQPEIESPEVTMYNYLTRNFHQNQDSIFLIKPTWLRDDPVNDSICGYHIMFKEGHSFKHEGECNEWGEIVTVSFRNISSEQVKKLVDELYSTKGYNWYNNNTEYRPDKYYERLWTFRITESSNSTKLEFSYSWI